jgi:DASS family divalent anion:Na+ symporter
LLILTPTFSAPKNAWISFSIFFTVIIGLILRPLPMGLLTLLGVFALPTLKLIPIQSALSGYGDSTVWLVLGAYILAHAVIKTGFGGRIALILIKHLGGTPLGLGYAICSSELLLAPFVPSNTARGGGILAPIVNSITKAVGSERYLVTLGAHANLVTSAMFMTAMAANPLISKAASQVFNINFDWGTWALGAIVPGVVSLLLLPHLIIRLEPNVKTDTKNAKIKAINSLNKIGPWKNTEKIMAFTFFSMLLLWTTKSFHGMSTTLVAWIGVFTLLLTGILNWKNILENSQAWDTFIWLGGLLSLANALKETGFIKWISQIAVNIMPDSQWMIALIAIAIIYFYSMYFFSMLTAHISALIFAFLTFLVSVESPAILTVALLAYFSNLCGCLTHYSTGPVILYFSLGYVEIPRWLRNGFLVSIFHLTVWLCVGFLWWKILGWW